MKQFLLIVKRNIKMYFKDKGLFISSLITPLILLVLYATFLARYIKTVFRVRCQKVWKSPINLSTAVWEESCCRPYSPCVR